MVRTGFNFDFKPSFLRNPEFSYPPERRSNRRERRETIVPATIIFNPENRRLFLLNLPKKIPRANSVAKIKTTEIGKACQIARKPNMTKRKGMMQTIEALKGASPSTKAARSDSQRIALP